VNEVDRVAVTLYPQLMRLIVLRDGGGWTFQPVTVDSEMELVAGWRLWPLGWSDAIAIRDVTDAKGYRCDPAGGEVWGREGTLVEVLDALLELPEPTEPGAPALVKARRPTLWTPDR
jgi:hypothetical protein